MLGYRGCCVAVVFAVACFLRPGTARQQEELAEARKRRAHVDRLAREENGDEAERTCRRQLDLQRRLERLRNDFETAGRGDGTAARGHDMLDRTGRQRDIDGYRGPGTGDLDINGYRGPGTGVRPSVPGRRLPLQARRGRTTLEQVLLLRGDDHLAQEQLALIRFRGPFERAPFAEQLERHRAPETGLESLAGQRAVAVAVGAARQQYADMPAEVLGMQGGVARTARLRDARPGGHDDGHERPPPALRNIGRIRRTEEERIDDPELVAVRLERLERCA